jgi:hypothetical protein
MDEKDLEEEGKNRKRNVLGIERKMLFFWNYYQESAIRKPVGLS